jgi:hypothetical protein
MCGLVLWHCHVRRDESRLYGNRDADRSGLTVMLDAMNRVSTATMIYIVAD